MHSNQTGCFPTTSSKGNKYIMVLVKVNGNYINPEPTKNKSKGSMIKAYLALWNQHQIIQRNQKQCIATKPAASLQHQAKETNT
jgi:hypothetical protein